MAHPLEIGGPSHAHAREPDPVKSHGVRAQAERSALVVGHQRFRGCHGLERGEIRRGIEAGIERTRWTRSPLDLPERRASLETEASERADLGQPGQLIPVKPGASDEIVSGRKRPLTLHEPPRFLPEPADIAEPEPHGAVGLDDAEPVRVIDVRRPDRLPVARGISHDGGGMVEAHGLVVEQRRVEGRRVMRLEIRAGIGQQREAGRVAFREAVQGEGGDGAHDGLCRLARDPLRRHAVAELSLHLVHGLLAALEAEGAPQFLRLAAGEARRRHGHAQQLFLEERHAERALEDGLEGRMRHGHGLAPRAAPQIRMHHVAHDRAGSDDGHLDDQVVEALGLEARQGHHLGTALHLEDTDGVGLLKHGVDRGVVRRQVGQVHVAAALMDHAERVLEERHHPESQKIHLDDAHGRAVVLVPLDDRAPGHGGGLEWDHAVEPSGADDHAARVLAEMARQILDGRPEMGEVAHDRLAGIAAGLAEMDQEAIARILVFPVADEPRQPVAERRRQAERLADFPRRAPAPVGDDVRGHRRAQPPVALVDVLDDPLAPVPARQIEIDVGPLAPLLGKEALEEQLHPHRVDGRDPERVAHGAVGGRAPPLHQDVVATAVFDQVPDDQEVARQVEAADEIDFALDLFSCALCQWSRAVARPRARLAEGAEEADRRLARRQRVVGEAVAQVLEREAEPQCQLAAIGHGRRAVGEEPLHLARRLEKALAAAREQTAGLCQRHAVADAGQRVQQRPIFA